MILDDEASSALIESVLDPIRLNPWHIFDFECEILEIIILAMT